MLPLLIIKAGDTFPETRERLGDFQDWVMRYTGLAPQQTRIIDPRVQTVFPGMDTFSGAIMTGSHAMITDPEPWIIKTLDWIKEFLRQEKPFLGICFGHQALAMAAGGKVGFHPMGKEVGTMMLRTTPEAQEDILFKDMPLKFPGHTTHTQAVLELPDKAVVLAHNDFEPHHALRVGTRAWGVQFHPEFFKEAMGEYIDQHAQALQEQGENIAALHRQTVRTEASHSLLKRFVQICAMPL